MGTCLKVCGLVHSSNSDVHHLPPDPTLTVENMNHVMAKVEPKERERERVYEGVLDYGARMKIREQYLTDSEREVAYVDAYVNYQPSSSWHELAKALYQRHHVAAVEEVRTYLPPRGESPCMSVTTSANCW